MSSEADTQRPAHLAIHFDDHAQQFDTAKFGMWLFLGSEVLFFSGLFVLYAVFRGNHTDMFHYGQYFLDWKMGALNTMVLIGSSLAAAWAVRCAQLENRKGLVASLVITLLLAGGFLVVKYFEYTHKIHGGVLWGASFNPSPEILAELPEEVRNMPVPANMGLFFSIYFLMTGLHGIHVVIGMGLFIWLIIRAKRGDFTRDYFGPVDIVALYWHLVDLIWIFLFPLLYLIG